MRASSTWPDFCRSARSTQWRTQDFALAILVQVEIAERLFDGAVFGLLQAFGKFARKHVFLRFFGFHRRAEFRFDGILVLAKQARGVVEIDRRRPTGATCDSTTPSSRSTVELGPAARALGGNVVGFFAMELFYA